MADAVDLGDAFDREAVDQVQAIDHSFAVFENAHRESDGPLELLAQAGFDEAELGIVGDQAGLGRGAVVGPLLVALGRHDEAIAAFRGALGRWERQLGAEHPFLAHPLTGLGRAHLAAGRPAEALPPLERALRLREAREPDANMVAETRFALAKALWSAGTDRARARRLAEQTRDIYLRDRARASGATEVSTWLLAHGAK